MSAERAAVLARRIHAADGPRAVVYVSGGGTEVFPMLLAGGGGSATLLSARVPYCPEDFRAVLGCDPGRLVDVRAARGMAMAAFRHALTIRGDLPDHRVFGLGATSKLSRGEGERAGRSHEIHAALQSPTRTMVRSVVLDGGADRAWEERINALVLLNLLALGRGVDDAVPLESDGRSPAEGASTDRAADLADCRFPGLDGLILGRRPWVARDLEGGPGPTEIPRLLLPGSFRPLHDGHVAMADAASVLVGTPCGFEMTLFHPEKPPLDYLAISSRLRAFEGRRGRLYLTNSPTFVEKARLFPGCTFVVGHDTATRIVDPRFYGGTAGRDAMLEELESLGTGLLVFGRVDASGRFRDFSADDFEGPVAGFLARRSRPVPEHVFRLDLSSTQVRERTGDHPD